MGKTLHKIYVWFFIITGTAVFIALVLNGYDYYFSSEEIKVALAEKHLLLKPSGILGHGLGIVGTLMMLLGVALYMMRKRIRILFSLGYLKHWLELHIFLCTVGPLLILFHTAFKFGGIVAISLWSMAAVVLSGVLGRFIYLQIPRTIEGRELSLSELNEFDSELDNKIKKDSRISRPLLDKIDVNIANLKKGDTSLKIAVSEFIRDIRTSRKLLREIEIQLSGERELNKKEKKEILALIGQKITLARRVGLLKAMQNLFRYWHIAHLPFAIVMFIIMIVHVAVALLFGYRWIF